MKTIIMKVGLIIMALTTMITMNACSKLNNDTAENVCRALAEKYGEDFVAVKIGDRFNTGHAKLYVHPANNEEIVFTARIDKNTGAVEDNYVEERVNYQVEEIIRKIFSDKGISVASRCMVVSKDPLNVDVDDYSPKSFKDKYLFDHYTIYLVIEDGAFSAADILSAVKNANDSIGVKLVIAGYVFGSGYSACVAELREIPDMSISMIEAKSPAYSFDINVDSGVCSITETELAKKLGRS